MTRSSPTTAAAAIALLAPLIAHAAALLTPDATLPIACAAIQAPALGVLAAAAARRRWPAAAIPALLLAALALGARHDPQTALQAYAGTLHALLYTGLLATFARSLAPHHEALVTRMARLANPHFHPGMVPYTRKVTLAWCALFAAQLAASAFLLATAPAAWHAFVSGWHLAALPALMLAELLARRIRFRHERPTGLRATIQAIRAVRRAQAPPANRPTIP